MQTTTTSNTDTTSGTNLVRISNLSKSGADTTTPTFKGNTFTSTQLDPIALHGMATNALSRALLELRGNVTHYELVCEHLEAALSNARALHILGNVTEGCAV